MQTQLESSDRPTTVVWNRICPLQDIWPGTGAAALVDGQQIAIILMPDGQTLYATANFDPFSKAFVMARGIVGDRDGVPKIASPIFKQNFDLRTGICLDDPAVALTVYPCRVVDGQIEIGITP